MGLESRRAKRYEAEKNVNTLVLNKNTLTTHGHKQEHCHEDLIFLVMLFDQPGRPL